jgi:hypothetical protein
MAEQQEFDPRFDPAFQRGYKPPAKPQTVPSIPVDSIGEPPVAPDPEMSEGAATEDGVPEDAATEATAIVGRRGVNPYVVILWLIGVVFAVGGTALLFWSYLLLMTSYTTTGPAQAATAQALYVYGSVFGVPLITVGLATIAGLIFFSAWRSWHRRGGSSA